MLPTPIYPPTPFTTGAWGLPLLWLDFETYYSSKTGYTLSKMTPEEYVRDPRFQVVGVHVITSTGQRYTAIGPDKTRELLTLLDLTKWCVVSHNNGGFDGLVLTLHYGIKPGAMACTIDMARPHMPPGQSLSLSALSVWAGLPPKGHEVESADGLRFEDFPPAQLDRYMNVYCPRDTENCYHLYQILRHTFYTYENGPMELEVLSETLLCTVTPHFQEDTAILEEEVARLTRLDEERESRLLQVFNCDQAALHKFLGSGKRLAGFLEALGVKVPMKPSKSDPTKVTYAFAKDDEAFTNLALPPEEQPAVEDGADDPYPWHLDDDTRAILADVVTARLGLKSSIRRARAERMLAISKRGPFGWPIIWRGAGATGRWAAFPSYRVNRQNTPKERRPGFPQEALRRAMKAAAKDHVVVSADSAQVEARCVVTSAGQEDMRLMFEQGAPIYEHMAQMVFGRPISKKDPERQVGKFTILGCLPSHTLVLTDSGAQPIVNVDCRHRLWDGLEWVSHDGVIFKGRQPVFEFQGLQATADHLVWTEAGCMPFARAIAAGAALTRTGLGDFPVRLGDSDSAAAAAGARGAIHAHDVHGLWGRALAGLQQLGTWAKQGLPALLAATRAAGARVAGGALLRSLAPLHPARGPGLAILRWAGGGVPISLHDVGGPVDDADPRAETRPGDRPHRQHGALRGWQCQVRHTQAADRQPPHHEAERHVALHAIRVALHQTDHRAHATGGANPGGDTGERAPGGADEEKVLAHYCGTVEVFDIVNAGPRHRFTANGVLVHNCGFGASGGTLYKQMRKAGVKTVTPTIADEAVATYRTNASMVPKAWRDWNLPLKAIENGRAYAGLRLTFGPRDIFVVEFIDANSFKVILPSGRPLYYRDVRWEYIKTKDAEGWTYLGREERPDGRVVTSRVSIYGAKLYQNWVQAVSCDFIAYAAWLMRKQYGHTMAGNAHDELTYVAHRDHAPLVQEQLVWCMRQRPAWMPDMPLDAEGAFGESYADV